MREIVRGCAALGVEVLTLYTFSTENWNRPAREVSALMSHAAREPAPRAGRAQGEQRAPAGHRPHRRTCPAPVRRAIDETQEYLSGSTGMLLNLALSYGGRVELVDAIRRMLGEGAERRLQPQDVDEELVSSFLYTAGLPDPDLLIRTSGEMRISNFMLWQLAYTEFWITETLWPDFRRRHLLQAIAEYQRRERRFGRVD